MNQRFVQTMAQIEHALRSVDESIFTALVDDAQATVERGGKIILSGLGKNVAICDKVVGTLLSLGIPAGFLHTNSAVHGDLGMVRPGDLVILLSKSGETEESILLAHHLLKRPISRWLLTFSTQSTLSKLIPQRLILSLDHEGDPWNCVPNNSTTINLILLQTLAMALIDKLQISCEQFLLNHPGGAIGKVSCES